MRRPGIAARALLKAMGAALVMATAPALYGQGVRISTHFPPSFSTFHLSFSHDGKFLVSERQAAVGGAQTIPYISYDAAGNEIGPTTSSLTYEKDTISTIPIRSEGGTIYYGGEHFTDPQIPIDSYNSFWPQFNSAADRVIYLDGIGTRPYILPIALPFDGNRNRIRGDLGNDNPPLFTASEIDSQYGADVIRYLTSPTRDEFYFIGEINTIGGGVELYRYSFGTDQVKKISSNELNSMGALNGSDVIELAISPSGDYLAVAVAQSTGGTRVYRYHVSLASPPSPPFFDFSEYLVTVTEMDFITDDTLVYRTLLADEYVPYQLGYLDFAHTNNSGAFTITNAGDFPTHDLEGVRVLDSDTFLLLYEMDDFSWKLYYAGFALSPSRTVTITADTGALEPRHFAVSPDRKLICYSRYYLRDYPDLFAIAPGEEAIVTHRIGRTGRGDYDGDGVSEIAVFRPASGLWSVRSVTRVYFGGGDDQPLVGDFDGDGTADFAIHRPSGNLWAIRGVTRFYFGGESDRAVSSDFNGDGTADAGIFRDSSGLWAIQGVTRIYFGSSGDTPIPGYYDGDGTADIALFRPGSGLWALRGVSRTYFGAASDNLIPGDYVGLGLWLPSIFRAEGGLWAVRGMTRIYFGSSSNLSVPADFNGDGADDIGIFRDNTGLWAVQGITRTYYGSSGDIPVTR